MEYLEFETLNFVQRGRGRIGRIQRMCLPLCRTENTLLELRLVEN